ncbi:FAD-dependent monooxygenase [Corallococcus llansteffanensis]|uniref:2,4-dichlorophenol 6-monooxygenase n=1 Tax=Corallococcus llansteffanensis TaxID=2316731 RepID=A0A3A8P117_9BACT|nr:FAD-dependent monooxygenase [Corallococcus llansteffanensis]RKH50207.1 2,4-dichlorophenol 6-monooxygenase [Corallococcus llansteffanensis]
MEADSTAVLVVGGSLVGLSSALFLASRGVPTVVVERHPGSSPHPRAIGFTPRTLELFRAAGLGERIPQVPPGLRLRRARAESLAGKWFEETPWTPEELRAPELEYSPCRGAALAQDRLEPILREKALALGADVRLETQLLRFEQDADGVVATLRGRDGQEYELRADYMIAADGHRSPIREALGIGRGGRGHMRTVRSIIFRAPLQEYLQAGVSQFNLQQPGFEAFLTTYGDGRWLLIFSDDVERDDATLRAMIHRAIGRDDLEVELVTTGRWEVSALIADRFASGRVFLAGDSAHTLPPNRGGYGANTGIEDAHNLAWKLAAVHSGASTPALLDTYDAERRPIAWLRHQQIFARADFKAHAGAGEDAPIIDDAAMELGQLYRSAAVLGADATLPPAMRPDQWAGQPGTRAPHAWVDRGDERVSTLDLFQRSWVLLAEDARWCSAAALAAEPWGIALEALRIGTDVRPCDLEAFRKGFGLGAGGATLIRPDGYVAWRSQELPEDPLRTLTEALGRVASAAKPLGGSLTGTRQPAGANTRSA